MKKYVKAEANVVDFVTEGVYTASGDSVDNNKTEDSTKIKKKCRFNRNHYEPTCHECQSCSKSGGVSKKEHTVYGDFKTCIDNMPRKANQK